MARQADPIPLSSGNTHRRHRPTAVAATHGDQQMRRSDVEEATRNRHWTTDLAAACCILGFDVTATTSGEEVLLVGLGAAYKEGPYTLRFLRLIERSVEVF
jgi:hypothetical protein